MAEDEKQHPEQRKERELTENLISESESLYNDEKFVTVITAEHLDNITSWDAAIPNCKYAPQKRKRPQPATQLQEEEEAVVLPEIRNRRHNMELSFVDCPAWQYCIEPRTYRYVINNGRYRASKLARKLALEKEVWKAGLAKDKVLTVEQKQLQKAIQKQLRREFEMYIRMELKKEACKDRMAKEARNDYSKKQAKEHESTSQSDSEEPIYLPPVKVPTVKKKDGTQYMHERLSALDEEIRRDSPWKKSSDLPEEEKIVRSHSEPQSSHGTLVKQQEHTLLGMHSSKPKYKKAFAEKPGVNDQVLELATQLASALAKLKESQDAELERQGKDVPKSKKASVKSRTMPSSHAEPVSEFLEAPIEKFNGDQKPLLGLYNCSSTVNSNSVGPQTHNVKYMTSTGNVINIAKFGCYSGAARTSGPTNAASINTLLNAKESDKTSQKSDSPKNPGNCKSPNIVQKQADKKDTGILQDVITTKNYVHFNGKNCQDLSKYSIKAKEMDRMSKPFKEAPKIIKDSFHSMPVGQHKVREKRSGSHVTQQSCHTGLPEISGRGLPKSSITSNKIT